MGQGKQSKLFSEGSVSSACRTEADLPEADKLVRRFLSDLTGARDKKRARGRRELLISAGWKC